MARYAKGLVRPTNIDSITRQKWATYGGRMLRLPRITAPTWDCRTLGLVPPIVDQGQCGSCWDFSGTGVVNSVLIMAGVLTVDQPLSEQYTLDCGQNGGCNGDDNSTVMEWAKTTGLPLTADYGPYQGSASQCKSSSSMKLWKITDWGYADNSTGVADTQKIKDAMVKYGPIGAAIAADDAFMNNPAGTVFAGSGSTDIDHDIILCGWDDSKGAWLLRNSWGPSWCDSGYTWIKYGANLVGTSALWGFTQPVPPQPHVCPPGQIWDPSQTQCVPFLPMPGPLSNP
jgi:C1A family cysteine protease